MKKNFRKISLQVAAGVVSLLFLIWISGIAAAYFGKTAPVFPAEVQLSPAHQAVLGADVKLDFTALVPAGRKIEKMELDCGEGAVNPVPLTCGKTTWLWNKKRCRFEAVIRPLRSGMVAAGKITVVLSPELGGSSRQEITVHVPEFQVVMPPEEKSGGKLQLSPLMDEPPPENPAWRHIKQHRYVYIILLLLLAAAALIILLFVTRKRRPVSLPPWEIALAALHRLRSSIAAESVTVENGFNELTDILREYLERRFGFPASRCTTDEFLNRLAQGGFPLPEQHKTPLAAFLNAADLIRFARMPSDFAALDRAAVKMEQLVQDTAGNAGKE